MFAILKKEINTFFASPIGYLVIAIFLILNGLFLWLFKGEFNILDNGFADLNSFFTLAPWILLFLIPAVTMRSFSDEKKQGTLELLLTKPISHLHIVLGKFFGAFVLIFLALLPTLLYVYTVNSLGDLDTGSTLGSYLGLLFLVIAYSAIGIFASTLSDNQIVAFISAVFLCLLFFIGFEGLADALNTNTFRHFGMSEHYKSMSRGVLDTRDLIYFLSVTTFFILLTVRRLSKDTSKKKRLQFLIIPAALIALTIFSNSLYGRFDLTEDKRYTLSESTHNIVNDIEEPLIVDIFLEGEEFPSEFRRLKSETKQLLEEFSTSNNNVKFSFINPLQDEANRDINIQQLSQRGLTPMRLSVQENGKSSEEVIFPWALASYGNSTVKIPLIKNKIGATQQELVSNSVQHLEYAFADGFNKLLYPKRRKIAVLKGNGQLENKYIADFIKTLRDYYFIAPFTLDSVASVPQRTLDSLNTYDLIISAKPTKIFTEAEKLVLDQYTMNGGKSLWLIDKVIMEEDSLYNETNSNISLPRDLNLTDFFFKYGVRINPVLVSTLYSAPITLAMGEGSDTQLQRLRWPYSPLVISTSTHPIVHNLNLVKFDFANQIDTLKTSHSQIKKTILLQSAPLSKLEGVPKEISLEVVTKEQDPKLFNQGSQNLAVLLEGEFTSAYSNRVKPLKLSEEKSKSTFTKMVVIADGDLIKNDIGRNGPLELGFNRDTGQLFGNKEFLLNTVNYLLDDDGLINIRSKEVTVAFLDQEKISTEKTKWQLINIGLPLLILGIFGGVFNYLRKKKYAK